MEEGNSDSAHAIFDALVSRGWSFRSPEKILDLVKGFGESGGGSLAANAWLHAVEAKLLSMDMASFGGKSIPDSTALKRSSHLQGPKVLQVVSSRDICQSMIEASMRISRGDHRLLRLVLTDGNCKVTAIEYSPIPAIKEDVIPGNKVLLENKLPVHNGILCLSPKVVTVLGGVVDPLYEEWQLDQKYSAVSQASSRSSHNKEGGGPPPFEKLQLQGRPSQVVKNSGYGNLSEYSQRASTQGHVAINRGGLLNSASSSLGNQSNVSALSTKKMEESTSSSEARPKEAVEVMPIQNQAAAQKLLQKMTQPNERGRPSRGQHNRGKGKAEEAAVFTLEEWERRKAGMSKPVSAGEMQDVSHDEEMARQLQRQLDLEDSNVLAGHETEAEKIRMSMFKFGREEQINDGMRGSRGRGRGRGRGRRRFG